MPPTLVIAILAFYLIKSKSNINILNDPNENIKIISETSTKTTGRAILQLTDDMTLIKRYDTIAQAVRETGVNSKSIRDAAKGVQKHAGGYVWKYADEIGK